MQIGAIIPLKVISTSKSRLRKANINSEYNEVVNALSEKLFYTTLSAIFFSEQVSEIIIATSDPRIIDILTHLGISSYLDQWTDLNQIVNDGISILRSFGCEMVLILMADLPYLSEHSIDPLLSLDLLKDHNNCLAILRSLDRGTTGLVQKPMGITPSFLNYVDSAEKHQSYANSHNVPSMIVDTNEFSFDIDTADDLYGVTNPTDNSLLIIIQQLKTMLSLHRENMKKRD
jgi:2-phospho-L-lactate guanylyltransferase